METLRAGRFGALLTLAWMWSSPGDSQRVEMPRKELEVTRGQMVVLQAWYSPTPNFERNAVIWNYMANDSKQIITFTSGEIGIPDEFRKRVGFAMPMPSTNLSIYINNTQESDTGRYLCNVLVPGAPGLSGELRLNVKVPPSPPVCSLVGRPVLKGNVTLSCKSRAGKPTPQYKWTRVAPVSEVYFSPMQNERQGTLRLNNLTKSMSGKYVCRASNTAGAESCFINLEVSTPTSAGMIAGAAVGSVVGLVAIVLFLVFILRRRRDTEDEIANEIKEDAQAPKRVSWAKSGTGSDIISKNGTLSSIATSPPPHESMDQLHHHHHLQQPPGNHYSYASPREMTPDPSALVGYRLRPGQPNPLHGLPGYNASGSPVPTHTALPLGPPHSSHGTHTHTHTHRPASATGSRNITANGPANHTRCTSVADLPLSTRPVSANGPIHAPNPRPVTANGPVHTSSPRPITANGPVHTSSPRPITANGPVHTSSIRPTSANSQIYTANLQPISANGPIHPSNPRSVNSNGPVHASSPQPISANSLINASSPHPISVSIPTPDPTLHRTDGAEPQAPPPATPQPHPQSQTLPPGITIATLSRMGAVPVMVPSQSQAGSLV